MSAKSLMRIFISLSILSILSFASIGRITAINGDVSVIRGDKTQKAVSNFQLEEKDSLKSSANSTAQIIFNDKTIITLGSNTTFKVEEYLFSEKNSKARFNVGEGTFKTITGNIAKAAPDKFKVETKTATIGIRGTIFIGTINPQGFLTIACLKGKISVTPMIPTLPPMILNQGQITNADPNKGVETPKQFSPSQIQNLEKPLVVSQGGGQSGQGGQTQGASSGFLFSLAQTNQGSSGGQQTVALAENSSNIVGNVVGEIKTTTKSDSVKTILTSNDTTYSCPSGYSGTYPNCVAPSCPTGYTGTYPDCVAPACPAGYTGTYPNCVAPSCPTGYTGTYPNCVAPSCPAGYTGTYPNCVAPACPTGYTGTYPNCVAPSCPAGYTGTYPDCVAPACPTGYTGTYPNCVAPACPTGYTGIYPNCIPQACPDGYTGLYPNCIKQTCPEGYTGTYPNCVAPACPTGYTGTYPNCVAPSCPTGYTGTYPNCVAPSCPTGYTGTYPNCVAPACPTGYTGTYPNCVAPACPTGYTGTYPNCVAPSCPAGYTGTYPNCVAPSCPSGYSGTYPDCTPPAPPPPPAPTCPSGTVGTYPSCVSVGSFSALFSTLGSTLGTINSATIPNSSSASMTLKQYTYDRANAMPTYKNVWVSSGFDYLATDTSGDLFDILDSIAYGSLLDDSATNTFYSDCLSGCANVPGSTVASVYVKTDVANPINGDDIVEIRNFAHSSNIGTAEDFYYLAPIAKTYADLVTSVKSLTLAYTLFAYNIIKYEPSLSYPVRNWYIPDAMELNVNGTVLAEQYYDPLEPCWTATGRYAANYADLATLNTTGLDALKTVDSKAFYVLNVPSANQNLPQYGHLTEGGKWYFTYDDLNPNFASTIKAVAGSNLTDAVVASSASVPFMGAEDSLTYPIYVVDMSGHKHMYSLNAYGNYGLDFDQRSNLYDLLINTDHVVTTSSTIDSYSRVFDPQATYVFNKINNDGTLAIDDRNGRLVNPLTGVALDVYANFMIYDSPDYTYFSGPIDNPRLADSTTYNEGVLGVGTLDLSPATVAGSQFWKLAIERAPILDIPTDEQIYVYGTYASTPVDADFTDPAKTGTYIRYPVSGDAVLLGSYLKTADDPATGSKYAGVISTGRVVDDGFGLNKIVAKQFDMGYGIQTSGVANSYGFTSNQYLFNDNGQFVNANIGGLDNDRFNSAEKYNWLLSEAIYSGVAVNASLMKKVADGSDMSLFKQHPDYMPTGGYATSGFMIGADSLSNVWMGDITTLDTATTYSGELNVVSPSNDLGVASYTSMAGLSQGGGSAAVAGASYIGEDLQAMIVESKTVNSKTYDFAMATLPDYVYDSGSVKYSYIDDYSSWGYWMAREQGSTTPSYAYGYWVSGYETAAAAIAAAAIGEFEKFYSGNLLGTVTNGLIIAPIKLDGDNNFNLSVKFGSVTPVQITNIQFNTVGLGSVNSGGVAPNFATGFTSSISGASFETAFNGGQVSSLNAKGKFFGPDMQSVGGAWSGAFNNGASLTGNGVFKAREVSP